MSKEDLDRVCDLVKQQGLTVVNSYFGERMAGSWYLEVAGQPILRVAWDGREGTFTVLEQTGEKYDGFPLWRDLWEGRGPESGRLEFVVSKLQEFSHGRLHKNA